jgi:hypothetical protein
VATRYRGVISLLYGDIFKFIAAAVVREVDELQKAPTSSKRRDTIFLHHSGPDDIMPAPSHPGAAYHLGRPGSY